MEQLTIVHFSPVEPDVIVSEFWIGDDRLVAELIWGIDGSKLLHFAEGKSVDFSAVEFSRLLSRESTHLDQWADQLRAPGGAWDPDSPSYTRL